MSSSLTTSLLKLARMTAKTAEESKASGRIKKSAVPFLRQKMTNFTYNEGAIGFQSSFEQVNKEEWPLVVLFQDLNSLKAVGEFNEAVRALATPQAELWVFRFTQTIFGRALNGLSDDEITDLTFRFIRDVEGSPNLWRPVVWLNGIWLSDEKVSLGNGSLLRRPQPVDLEREIDMRFFPIGPTSTPWNQLPMAILEYRCKATNEPEAQYQLERFLTALRLFKVGSVASIRVAWESDSVLMNLGGTQFTWSPQPTAFKYPFGNADKIQFDKFVEVISPLIPDEFVRPTGATTDYLVTALQRYNDALMKPEAPVSRITSAIMCLEALLLRKEEQGELEHRLAQRLARTLEFLRYQPLEVYHTLKRAYEIRSNYVHGSPIPKEQLEEANTLSPKIVEYARLSVIINLRVHPEMEKEKFLSLLDSSLLSEKAKADSKELITKASEGII